MTALTIHDDPPRSITEAISAGLRRFDEEQVGPVEPRALVISASDDGGEIIGGIKARVLWGWVYIEALWVSEAHRGGGVGGALLQRLESEPRARGAARAALLTTSWQAPAFYTKRGYATIASFDLEIPSGPRRGREVDYLLVKSLRP